MNKIRYMVLLMSVLAWGMHARAEPEPAADELPLSLAVDLVDGSRVVGVPGITSLSVQTSYARLEVELKHVRTIAMEPDRELAVFEMRNGDRLKGALLIRELELKTAFGDVKLGADQVARITVTGRPVSRAGLLLWNTLGSEAEILHSRAGPPGVFRGGRFAQGVAGNAFVAEHDQNGRVAFPGEVIPPAAGCIEIWARLDGVPAELRWSETPRLFSLDAPEGGVSLMLNGNDGGGRGGVVGGVAQLGVCATGSYGSWTYAQALGGGDGNAWHHYALVWDQDGIKGLDDGQHTVAVFVDGKLNSKVWAGELKPGSVTRGPLTQGELALMLDQHLDQGRVLFDELKIWSFAKTEFADSLDRRPVR